MSNAMTIGTLARREGLTPETLRYYERLGLIVPSHRTASNYRLYDLEAARRLRFIRRAQALGFSLGQIGEMLALHARPESDMGAIRQLTDDTIADIEARIADLERMKTGLLAISQHCPGHGPAAECPILAALLAEDH